MGAIKDAVNKIGEGISHAVEAVGGAIEGAAHVVKGVVTCNPNEIMHGLHDMKEAAKEAISAAGELAAGAIKGAVNMTPLGFAVNELTKGALDGFLEGTVNGLTGTITRGIDGVEGLADGIVHGDVNKIMSSAMAVGEMALLVAPVGMAANMGKAALTNVAKDFIKDAVTDQAMNVALGGAANLANHAGLPPSATAAIAGGAALAGGAAELGGIGGKHDNRPHKDTSFESAGSLHTATPTSGRVVLEDLTTANRKEIAVSLGQNFSATELKQLKADLSDFFNHGNDVKRQEISAKWGDALGTDFNDSDINKKLFFAAKDCA